MKTVLNKTHDPIRVPLPRGKTLHLGPRKTGQISNNDLEHQPLQKLVSEGVLEIKEDAAGGKGTHGEQGAPHAETHGHHPPTSTHVRGDR